MTEVNMGILSAFLGTPDPVAFNIFGYSIRWYAIMLTCGILAGFFLVLIRGKKSGLSEDDTYDVFLYVVPLAVFGARLYYVLFELDYYLDHPADILAVWKGGLAIHGAILFGALGVFLACRKKKIQFFKLADLVIPGVALGQAIGRWGNYFNMEAHGTETTLPWAIKVFENGQWMTVHPTFLYESIWDLVICLVLIFVVAPKSKYHGRVTAWYFILYSVGRFFIEGLRTDSLYIFGLRTARVVSILLFVCGTVFILLQRRFKFLPIRQEEAGTTES